MKKVLDLTKRMFRVSPSAVPHPDSISANAVRVLVDNAIVAASLIEKDDQLS